MTDDVQEQPQPDLNQQAMSTDKKYALLLPTSLRDDIGAAFSRVLSDDPSIKVPATRSFMALLNTAFVLNGDCRYDTLISEHTINSINAVALYASENWAAASELCYKIQADLGFLVYAGYGTSDGRSFTLPSKSQESKK